MVYDSQRNKIVLFGGDDDQAENDTWEYTPGAGWKKVATATAPPARYNHAMAYDSKRGRIILFGGRVGHHYRRHVAIHPRWRLDTASPPVDSRPAKATR